MSELESLASLPKVLNLGAGRKQSVDAFNVDLIASTNPNLVHDLNVRPWPLPDSHFKEVLAYDVIEHMEDIIKTMEEIHRVCAPGARVKITAPHYSSSNAFTDPTHRHYFSSSSFHYFTGECHFDFYTNRRFRRIDTSITFYPTLLNKLVWRLANRWKEQYERRWAWMFPAWFLYFELEVIKASP